MEFLELLKERNICFEKTNEKLVVFDRVGLGHTELKNFPDCSMIFLKEVDLSHTQIRKFPDYPIIFMDNLYIRDTLIKDLSNIITINNRLDISDTLIEKLPDNLICNELYAKRTLIEKLPDNLICNRLDIGQTTITNIPRTLIADYIYVPTKGILYICIQKTKKIVIEGEEKSIDDWKRIFKKREPIKNFDILELDHKDYNVLKQDFENAVKLHESWLS